MSWNLKGSYFETCSCDLMCPCNLSFDHGATYDYCRVTLVFHIREGEIEGTDVRGLQGRRDRGHAEGHDRRQLAPRHVRRRGRDRRADGEAQRRSSAGRWAARWQGLAPLVGEVLGVERAPIEVVEDGLRHSVRIGDAIDFEVEDIVPFGVETGQPVRFDGMFHPVASNLTMAEAKRSKINAFGIEYEGKSGLSTSEFSWAA